MTIVELSPHLVPTEEEEVSKQLAAQFTRLGINVLAGHQVTAAKPVDGGKQLTVRSLQEGTERTVTSEEILLATGLRSNAGLLQPEKSGVTVDTFGYIITDEFMRTSQKNIWAIGNLEWRN